MFRFRVEFWGRALGFEFRFRVLGFKFMVFGFRFRVLMFRLRVLCLDLGC